MTSISGKIAEVARQQFGDQVKTVPVMLDPNVVREVNLYLAQIELSHQEAKKSQIRFK